MVDTGTENDTCGNETMLDRDGSVLEDGTPGRTLRSCAHSSRGLRLDLARALYNDRNRSYSAALGRFMQEDPAGYVNASNTYQFEESSPAASLDPSGTSTYAWTIPTATAKLQAQLKEWQAKPGYGLQADLLAHFLDNTGTLFKCTDHPRDLQQVKNDSDFQSAVQALILQSIEKADPNNQGWNLGPAWNMTTPFKFNGTVNTYFDPSTDVFWAFASLHITVEGYATEACDGHYDYYAKVTFSKKWNFNHNHSWLDDLLSTFDAGQFLEDNGAGAAFGLNGWFKQNGHI